MKGNDEVIKEFNELVNMTPSELEKWLKSSDSNSAGWPKDSGDGESVGHDSGRKIVEILKDNPQKKPDKYDDDQIEHMRKVVSYCKRHLAQESAGNENKSTEELKKTKSYASLKNWGHDILKKEKENGKANGSGEAEVGDKRSRQDGPTGENKSRKTEKTSSAKDEENEGDDGDDDEETGEGDDDEEGDEDADADEEDDDDEDEDDGQEGGGGRKTRSKTREVANGQKNSKTTKSNEENDEKDDKKGNSSNKSKNGEPEPGDTVNWNWGQGQPEGKVLDVKHDKASVKTKRGNEVSRDGSDKDPAVILDTGKSKAIKLNHELN